MLYGIICVYLLAKAYECNVRYFILHRNVPLRSDVVQFFAVFAAQKICSLNPSLSLSLSLARSSTRDRHTRSANPFSHAHLTTSSPSFFRFLQLLQMISPFSLIDEGVEYVTTMYEKFHSLLFIFSKTTTKVSTDLS